MYFDIPVEVLDDRFRTCTNKQTKQNNTTQKCEAIKSKEKKTGNVHISEKKNIVRK
jgi:hypothetical protein